MCTAHCIHADADAELTQRVSFGVQSKGYLFPAV